MRLRELFAGAGAAAASLYLRLGAVHSCTAGTLSTPRAQKGHIGPRGRREKTYDAPYLLPHHFYLHHLPLYLPPLPPDHPTSYSSSPPPEVLITLLIFLHISPHLKVFISRFSSSYSSIFLQISPDICLRRFPNLPLDFPASGRSWPIAPLRKLKKSGNDFAI